MNVIGISGHAGAGKDTVAAYIARSYGFTTVAFADKLKRIVAELYDIDMESLFGASELRNIPDQRYVREDGRCMTPRDPLMTFGNDGGRGAYQDTWILPHDRVLRRLAEGGCAYSPRSGLEPSYSARACLGVVVPDTRYVNEHEYLRKQHNAKLIRVKRSSVVASLHRSEQEQLRLPDSYFDAVVVNDGTIAELHLQVERALFGALLGQRSA